MEAVGQMKPKQRGKESGQEDLRSQRTKQDSTRNLCPPRDVNPAVSDPTQ